MEKNTNVKEVIVSEIMKLDIAPGIKENPAFSKIVEDIIRLIPTDDPGKVAMTSSNGEIKISVNGEEYKYSIKCFVPEQIDVVATKTDSIYKEDGRIGTQKACIEKKIKLLREDELEVSTYMGSAKDTLKGVYYSPSEAEKKVYTKNGVVRNVEFKEYKESESIGNTRSVSEQEYFNILFIPHLSDRSTDNSYETITSIGRTGLDVAFVCKQDSKGSTLFKSHVQINNEYGVSDINIVDIGRYTGYIGKTHIDPVIHPFNSKLIEAIIKRDNDPRTQEELRQWAKGRESFYYNAAEDPDYVNKIDVKPQTL